MNQDAADRIGRRKSLASDRLVTANHAMIPMSAIAKLPYDKITSKTGENGGGVRLNQNEKRNRGRIHPNIEKCYDPIDPIGNE